MMYERYTWSYDEWLWAMKQVYGENFMKARLCNEHGYESDRGQVQHLRSNKAATGGARRDQ